MLHRDYDRLTLWTESGCGDLEGRGVVPERVLILQICVRLVPGQRGVLMR